MINELCQLFRAESVDSTSQRYGNHFLQQSTHPPSQETPVSPVSPRIPVYPTGRKSVFNKIFHWQPSHGDPCQPTAVDIAGTFTDWQNVPLAYDSGTGLWQVTLTIPAHHTHRYMILADGRPAYDRNSHGLTAPQGPREARCQLMTHHGPRVFMLFSETK